MALHLYYNKQELPDALTKVVRVHIIVVDVRLQSKTTRGLRCLKIGEPSSKLKYYVWAIAYKYREEKMK